MDTDKVPIVIKVISTQDQDITNQIVRGTNRQNIVLDEAFETTKIFHKDLEEFINALSPVYERFYYERRSKQYDHNPAIGHFEKIGLRLLLQSFIGMFLNEPHIAHRHESKLLEQYKNLVFQEHQSKLPYFTSTLAFFKLEKLFRSRFIDKKGYYPFRSHILMIFRELVGGKNPNLNNEIIADEHCQLLLKVLKNDNETKKQFQSAIKIFDEAKTKWIDVLKKDRFRIKDVKEFTDLLLTIVRKSQTISTDLVEDKDYRYKGRIVKVIRDKFGTHCGFIERSPNNIFFHSSSAKGINLFDGTGKLVSYKVSTNPKSGQLIAVEVEME